LLKNSLFEGVFFIGKIDKKKKSLKGKKILIIVKEK